MNFQDLLKNKKIMYILIGVMVFLAIIIIFVASKSSSGNSEITDKKLQEDVKLLTTDNLGKAIELQALLTRQGIDVERAENGSKSTLVLTKGHKQSQKDIALLTIVKSGIMDEHTGLEMFDKNDFTSTREDKKIKLIRAMNGELARLIRKMPNIDNASVFISIPEDTIFTADKKQVTATVQVTVKESVDKSDRLDHDQIRAITNLLMGSVQGLDASNISITDTNGNVYSSIISAEDDMMDRTRENDEYMQQKVKSQLDKIVGQGNYVATVSTFLKQNPTESEELLYNPKRSAVLGSQRFEENLGDRSIDKGGPAPVSVYVPSSVANGNGTNAASSKNYNRVAEEMQFGVSKKRIQEYMKPGTVEEISVAVTIDRAAIPEGMNMQELKELIAVAASPKAKAENVKIAFTSGLTPYLAGDKATRLPQPEMSGNPWWAIGAVLFFALLTGMMMITNKAKTLASNQDYKINELLRKTQLQDSQLNEMRDNTALLAQQQQQLAQMPQQPVDNTAVTTKALYETISSINDDIDDTYDDKEFADNIKSWIESSM